MWDSQRNNPEATKAILALAIDYLEVLATARSTRLLPGQRSLIALVRKTAAASAEQYQDPGNVSVVVFEERRDGFPKRLWEQLVGHGCGGTLLVRDLNRDRKDEIFFWVEGQACAAGVLQMVRSNQVRWLYRNNRRFQAEARDMNQDRLWEIVESWLTVQLDEPYYSQIATRRCLFARKIWQWDKHRREYRLWKVEPDWETQKRLSRDQLLRTPGAREILGQQK